MAREKSASPRARETAVFRNFLGVDFTSSPLQVSPRRSPQAVNLIADGGHGQNCKRHGWEQVSDLPLAADGKPRRVNGMWRFDDGRLSCLLVHAGDALYRFDDEANGYEPVAEGLSDERSQGFAFGGRTYFVGMGRYYVFGTWDDGKSYDLRLVEECEDVYAPTTTVGIGPIDSDTEGGESVEAVNLLTRWRINTLVGSDTEGATYRLDGGMAPLSPDVTVFIECLDEKEKVSEIVAVVDPSIVTGSTRSGWRAHSLVPEAGGEVIGKLEIHISGKHAELTLNGPFPPAVEDVPNITVRYAVDHADWSSAALIGGCRFGAVFGAGGNANRLFLTGNPDYANRQFWCEIGDPTYFPDVNACVVGSSAVPITGMMRLSDGVLAVFKADTGQEPTIYYQRAEEDVSGASEGGNLPLTLYTTAGNVGEAVISRFACADLYGDPLILSRNGVFGITMRANVATGDRYAVERSYFIKKRLCASPGLSEAAAIVCGGRYYLSVDGACYVADAEYRATPPGGSHFQYEWWYWEGVAARVFCELDGVLWFGTPDGRICRFTDGFVDSYFDRYIEGQMSLEPNRTDVAVSYAIGERMQAGDRVQLLAKGQHYEEMGGFYIKGGIKTADRSLTERIKVMMDEGQTVYLENTREMKPVRTDPLGNERPVIPARTRFVVGEVVLEDYYYHMSVYYTEEDGGEKLDIGCYYDVFKAEDAYGATTYFEVGDGDFRILIDEIDIQKDLYVQSVTEVEDGDGSTGYAVRFSEYPDEGTFTFPEGDIELSMVRKIHRDTPVYAEWYTPVVDLGSAMREKTLLRLSTVCEPGLGGRMEVGYETRRAVRTAAGGESGRLDLLDLDFLDFSFDGFASSHTVRICERHVNYVRLRVRSDGETDLRIHEMSLVYRIDRECRGIV